MRQTDFPNPSLTGRSSSPTPSRLRRYGRAGGAGRGSIAGAILGGAIAGVVVGQNIDPCPIYESRKSEKKKSSDIPSWAEGEKPAPDESGKDFADRLLDGKYGKGNYPKGPGSQHNKLKKYGDRSR